MAKPAPFPSRSDQDGKLVAVLGPTNTGKTHLAIERLCAHSSGAIGFPLRLLAREVYDRVCAIKGADRVALITGEERIEPPNARWLLCTAEAMPLRSSRHAGNANQDSRDLAFVALDEAQLCADRERGHIFTDRLLHARGREETMILGSATMQPMVRSLLPRAEINSRPRFSTLSHAGARKLSRIPPRSAIVAFSAEQVYVVAELLRRFRGGAAVVMGAMSPETRNRQVALYQSGEVDYLVATDAIGMGLNLDLNHVAFAGLSKYDGQRQRRLTPSEMAQIAGRAGRHHRDGTFGTLAGSKGHDAEFTDDEVYAIEENRFAPITRLFWRDAEPRLDSLETLIADLSAPPDRPELAPAPEAIDLAVMRRLAEDPDIAATVQGRAAVSRFRESCMLPDFRQQGAEVHSRFVARLWEDLRRGSLPTDYVAAQVAHLDNPSGDIDTLQGRLAAIRSWSYIAQRPDWVSAREEMAARTRAVEARLSDALHARLTERFVNRRLSVLIRRTGADAGLRSVTVKGEDVLVDGESIGKLEGFRFKVDPQASHDDRKLLLAAAERHLPHLLAERANALATLMNAEGKRPVLSGGAIMLGSDVLAKLQAGRSPLAPQIKLDPALEAIPLAERSILSQHLDAWLEARLGALARLVQIDQASREPEGGPELRALLIRLVEGGGVIARAGSGLDALEPSQRLLLRQLNLTIGTLDLFVLTMLKPIARELWRELAALRGQALPMVPAGMPSVIAEGRRPPPGYRGAGSQAIRVDLAERLIRAAHDKRVANGHRPFFIGEAMAISMGLSSENTNALLRLAGFRPREPRALPEGALGPPSPCLWLWQPLARQAQGARSASAEPPVPNAETQQNSAGPAKVLRRPPPPPPRAAGAFAALAGLMLKGK